MKYQSGYLLYLIFNIVKSREVAVILGGKDDTSDHGPVSVEVYSGADPPTPCPGTEDLPHVPDLPQPLRGASAIYVPDFGIYLCGGINAVTGIVEKSCYNYNPSVNRCAVKYTLCTC